MGPIFWLLIAEIYPLSVRGKAMSLATVANWGANFLITVTFLSLVKWIGEGGAFLLYAAIGVFAFFFIRRLVPETKGQTLEQIQAHWHAGVHPPERGGQPGQASPAAPHLAVRPLSRVELRPDSRRQYLACRLPRCIRWS
jgi:hypothetical protein